MLEPSTAQPPPGALAEEEPLGDYIPPEMREAVAEAAAAPKARGRQPYTNPPPWAMSAYIAACAFFFLLLFFAYPNVRRLPLPFGITLFTPYLALCLPLMSAGWALLGIVLKKYRTQWPLCLIGFGLSIAALAGILSLFWIDPSRW